MSNSNKLAALVAGGTPAVPSQTGNNGKFLTTDGSASSWAAPLPSQTSNSGKYLTTDGSNPSWGALVIPGMGGTTSTTYLTLTSASPAAVTITPALPGLYATLPDATTCTKANHLFAIYNAGDYDYGIKDSTGVYLGWIRPKSGSMIGLSDNSAAAGVWAYYGLEKTGITAQNSSYFASSGSTLVRVALDSTRTMLLFGGSSTYAIIYDSSNTTWGTPVLVRSAMLSNNGVRALLAATDKVIVCTLDTSTGFQAVIVSTAGTVATVNTAATATLTPSGGAFGTMVAVSTSFAVSYYGSGGTSPEVRAMTVSGNTVTIGGAISLNAYGNHTMFASGSILRTFVGNGSNVWASPYTVSGTTLTLGTGTSTPCTELSNRMYQVGVDVIHYGIDTNTKATIFRLSGTTEAVVNTAASGGAGPHDIIAISATKTAVIYGATASVNIITNTAGTPSLGTALVLNSVLSTTGVMCISVVGNTLRVAYSGTSQLAHALIDVSGASPTLISQTTTGVVSSGLPLPLRSDNYAVRNPQLLVAGSNAIMSGGGVNYVADICYTSNRIDRRTPLALSWYNGVVGANSSESWIGNSLNNSGYGYIIQRVEAAA